MIENGAKNGTPKTDKIAFGGTRGCPWAPKVAKKRVPKMVPKMDPEKNDFWSKTGPTGANDRWTVTGCWGPGGPPTARAGMIKKSQSIESMEVLKTNVFSRAMGRRPGEFFEIDK